MNYNEKKQFLKQHIFYGLENRNDGFDSPNIFYFTESDFEIVLNRIESLKCGIYGIEPWKNGEMYDVLGPEDYGFSNPTDTRWYWTAFLKLKATNEPLLYAATYCLPDEM